MSRVIDLEARRQQQQHQLKDARTAELKEALRSARAGSGDKHKAARKLLDLYKRKPPPQN